MSDNAAAPLPLGEEVRRSLYGALLLARREPRGMHWFNLTIEGFWRSFVSLLLAYPGFLAMTACERTLMATQPDLGRYLTIQTVVYVLQGIAFPIAMIFLARLLRLGATYVPFIIAYNWSNVWVTVLLLPPLLLLAFDGREIGGILNILASAASVYYRWFVTRTALATGGATALGLVVIDVILSVLISFAAVPFFGGREG